MREAIATVLVVAVFTGSASGQSGLQQRLAKATSLECAFSVVARGNWKSGTASADVTPATLTVAFKNINVDEGTADLEGKLGGSSLIVVRYSNDYLHLMQSQGDGPLYTTTVIAKESKEGRLMAVHTRHEYTQVSLPGFTSRPEMYVGDCAVK
ncbi:MAG TPA: hypothetical protein VKB50_17890 [Vicinamibacterales bacterium]|nr:hypothetical protein [Vicinamibacterales bacterium]